MERVWRSMATTAPGTMGVWAGGGVGTAGGIVGVGLEGGEGFGEMFGAADGADRWAVGEGAGKVLETFATIGAEIFVDRHR